MHRSTTRIGRWFALALALPCVFAATWLWLSPGGVVARARTAERAAAGQLLQRVEERYRAALQVDGLVEGFVLQLDEERRCVGPFAVAVADDPEVEPGIAELAALQRVDAGRTAEARSFFAFAARQRRLTPAGWLAYAEACSDDDATRARRILAEAREMDPDARYAGMPFELAALLLAARWPDPERDPDAVRDRFCELVVGVAPGVALAALADLDGSPVALDERRAAALRAAASVRTAFADRPLVASARCPDGTLVVLGSFGRSAVATTAARAARLRAAEFSLATTLDPRFEVVAHDAADGLAAVELREFGESWSVRYAPDVATTSSQLALVANAALVLALLTLVLGNLVVLRMTRRESQLVRLRADFVDIVSHELRTPLTALTLKAEMLAAGDVPEARRAHYLTALHHDVLRLNDQVERILDFGRLQRGAELRREVVPGRSLLAKGLREGRAALRLVEQSVAVDAARDLPAIVGDVDVLARALRNLLENAAKYAPRGSTVAVRCYAQARELVVEVADRGPGVPADDRDGIFQPFVRGREAPSGTPGSGLGLALVAAAAEQHGGRIGVSDRPGGGSVFTLTLPVRDEGASA